MAVMVDKETKEAKPVTAREEDCPAISRPNNDSNVTPHDMKAVERKKYAPQID
jgi:hypothetical protein